jgi:uncharacterized protein YkwD
MKKRLLLLMVCANVLFASTQANLLLEKQALLLVNALEKHTQAATQDAAQYRWYWASVLELAKTKRPDIAILPFLHNAILNKRDGQQIVSIADTHTDDMPDTHTDLLWLINTIRKENGLKPVVFNSTLNTVAKSYATYMDSNKHFSHVSLDGKTFVDRVDVSWYTYTLIGENIARWYNDVHSLVW